MDFIILHIDYTRLIIRRTARVPKAKRHFISNVEVRGGRVRSRDNQQPHSFLKFGWRLFPPIEYIFENYVIILDLYVILFYYDNIAS